MIVLGSGVKNVYFLIWACQPQNAIEWAKMGIRCFGAYLTHVDIYVLKLKLKKLVIVLSPKSFMSLYEHDNQNML